jgi:hypothetical protein
MPGGYGRLWVRTFVARGVQSLAAGEEGCRRRWAALAAVEDTVISCWCLAGGQERARPVVDYWREE